MDYLLRCMLLTLANAPAHEVMALPLELACATAFAWAYAAATSARS